MRIKPVLMKQSVYFRVPSNIAGPVEIHPNSQVTLHVKEQDDRFLLTYSVEKSPEGDKPELTSPMQMLEKSLPRKGENK